MNRCLLAMILASCFSLSNYAQEKNPFINSGEVIKEAVKLYDDGKYKESIDLFKKVNRSDTNYVYALYEKSLSYAADSQFNAAIETCRLAMLEDTMHERSADLLTQYGSLFDNIGQPERSIHIFDSAIAQYPNHSLLYLNKGTTLLGMKKYEEAEKVFQFALLQDPYSASCHYKLGFAALQIGKLVPAMYSFMNYLLIAPTGRYSNNCISYLNNIANNTDLVTKLIESRTEDAPEEYSLLEKIIQSKIALDKNYKAIIDLDDPISRQIQVLLEKANYNADSKDFCMQYYLPFYKQVYSSGRFEAFINYIFSGVNIAQIQNYNKKNKKEVQAFIDEAVIYFNKIRVTRQLNFELRKTTDAGYYYESNLVYGKGKTDEKLKTFVGDWTFYYPGGNIKSAGRYNEKGEREGVWNFYYPNGRLRVTQTFKNEQLDGSEIYYFRNGLVSSNSIYKAGKAEGEDKKYYYCGTPRSFSVYANNKLNGVRTQYNSNGTRSSTETFVDDKSEGPFATYYKNGTRASAGNYTAGLLEGPYNEWYENGQISQEGQYQKGKETGIWKKYYSSGKLKSTQTYVNGKEDSDYTEYYENGQVFVLSKYRKGMVNGDVTYNDDDGKPFAAFVFNNGKPVSARYLDKTGQQLSIATVKDKKLDLTSYYPDASKKTHVIYNSNGNAEGTDSSFYHNGSLYETNEYTDGQLNGTSTSFFLNGRPATVTPFASGQKDGYYKSFYSNGTISSEGWYKENLAEGSWYSYDEMGNLLSSTYYLNDVMDGHKEEYYKSGKIEYDTKYHLGFIESMIQYNTNGQVINKVQMQKAAGAFTGVHLNGKLKFRGSYINGDFNGPYEFYFFDGSKHVTQYYNKGEEDSIYKTYYYGGQLAVEGQFKAGKRSGTWKYYYRNGTVSSKEEYMNGELDGHTISYFENGKVDIDISYKEGQRNGETKKYEPGGNLMQKITYKNDVPVSYSYLDKNNQLLPDIAIPRGTGKLKTFYSNGQPAADYNFVEGKLNGAYKLFFPNGKTWSERNEEYGNTNGPLKEYYENGQLKHDYYYLNDNIHGGYKEYNEKGVLTEEGNFFNGNYHGEVKMYDNNGKLTQTYLYYYGNLLTVKK